MGRIRVRLEQMKMMRRSRRENGSQTIISSMGSDHME